MVVVVTLVIVGDFDVFSLPVGFHIQSVTLPELSGGGCAKSFAPGSLNSAAKGESVKNL